MQRYMTQDEVMAEFTQKIADLSEQGWVPYGDIMYYVNGVSQAMIMGDPDVSDLRPTGILNGHFKYKKIETP